MKDGTESKAAALASLPHGQSFRFVDEVTELDPGTRAEGLYHVRGDEAFLEGHFPGHPIMPGVILVEAVAQLAGIAAQSGSDFETLENVRLAAIRQAKIKGTAQPGDSLHLKATVTGRMDGLIQAQGTIQVNGAEILSAMIVLSGEPK